VIVSKCVVADYWGYTNFDLFKSIVCSRDNLLVLKKGVLPWTNRLYIDGVSAPFQDSDTNIKPSNSVAAVEVNVDDIVI
jgi:hypothetical protein